MNAESFADYLAQPAKLYQLSYQEIKNLVADYPFSANLRYLLLLKAKIEQDPNFERYLHQFGAHSPDRSFLYRLLEDKLVALLDLETEEDKLELLDIGEFKVKEPILLSQEEEMDANASLAQVAATAPDIPLEETAATEDDDDDAALRVDAVIETKTMLVAENEDTSADLSSLPEQSKAGQHDSLISLPAPTSAASFIHKMLPTTSHHQRFGRLRGQNLSRKTSGSAARVRRVAKASVADQTDLASETLAILLQRKGQYERAIEMYERLSLLNPEKSRYFAAAIEKLKLKF